MAYWYATIEVRATVAVESKADAQAIIAEAIAKIDPEHDSMRVMGMSIVALTKEE